MQISSFFIATILFSLISSVSCNNSEMTKQNLHIDITKDISKNDIEKITTKLIFFGHQSVGYNLLQGIEDIKHQNPDLKINIIESDDSNLMKIPGLYHSKVGKNRNPSFKINDFSSKIGNGIGKKVDMVALKLCYVDIKKDTNIDNIFTEYQSAVNDIKSKYPSLKIIHFTTPLKTVQTGFVAWIKKLIGKKPGGYANNIRRNQYTQKIINTYQDVDPIFDIANFESTSLEGKPNFFKWENTEYRSLVPAYTDDGGHLNKLGRKVIAEKFLKFLAKL